VIQNITSDAPDNCPDCGAVWSHGEGVKTNDDKALDGWGDWRYCAACKCELFYPQKLEEQKP
jgi:hypothetical protein